jgi:hypothetical protein
MKKRPRRAINDPPTKKHHLNDKIVNNQQDSLANQVMKLAVLTQPPPDVNLGGAFSNTLVIYQTNVQRPDANGGGNVNKPLLEHPRTCIISTGNMSDAALRQMADSLQQVIHNRAQMRDTSNDESDAPMIIDNNITMITNQQQLDKSREERNRKKARTLSVEETNKQIGITTIEYPVSDDDEDNNENVG